MTLSPTKMIVLILIGWQVTECKFEIDHYGVDLICDAANGAREEGETTSYDPADAITQWDASVGSGQEWLWKKHREIVPLYSNVYRKAA